MAGTVQTGTAQVPSDFEANRLSPMAYYVWGDATDTKVHVQVWGTVRNAGLYEIVEGTSLSTVLTLANPVLAPRQRRMKRTLIIQVVRPRNGTPEVILEQEMVNAIPALAQDVVLQEGDYITVDTITTRGLSWRDGLTILSAATGVAVLLERLLGS